MPSAIAQRRWILLVLFYGLTLTVAAVVAHHLPDSSSAVASWGSLIASCPLSFFGLGGNEARERRMNHRWWFLIPKFELLPFAGCFLFGLTIIKALQAVFQHSGL